MGYSSSCGTKTAKSIKPTKVSNAATANNTRRNQTPDAAETAVLAAVGVTPEEFSNTLASCDSPLKMLPLLRRCVSRFSASALASAAR
jgi:hypothetical protein